MKNDNILIILAPALPYLAEGLLLNGSLKSTSNMLLNAINEHNLEMMC